MSLRDRLNENSKEIKHFIILFGVLLVIIIIISVIAFLLTPYSSPPPILLRKAAFDRACDFWNSTYDCNQNMYEEPFLLYQDVDEEQRPYSVKELCIMLKLNEETCYKRCGCPYVQSE